MMTGGVSIMRCNMWCGINEGGWGVFQVRASFARIIECRRSIGVPNLILGVGVSLIPNIC